MKARFIDKFEVILLDMGNTFMFGGDRFGDGEDYYATYRILGGKLLSPDEVNHIITGIFDSMLKAAHDPARYDDFGDVRRFLNESDISQELPLSEVNLLIDVFSWHEVGKIPETHVEAIHSLNKAHPLGIVSNIWSPPDAFEIELKKAGLKDLFTVCIWSSNCLSIKPSSRLFQEALNAFNIESSRALYVGDHPMRDIGGAKAVGMAAVWIENEIRPITQETPKPDLIISDLTQLPTAIG